jgi:hypothetical protein
MPAMAASRTMLVTVLFIAALAALGTAGYLALTTSRQMAAMETVPGRIVGYEGVSRDHARGDSGGDAGRVSGSRVRSEGTYPIIEYTAGDGSVHRFKSRLDQGSLPEGQLLVVYPADKPEQGRVRSFAAIWIGPILCAALGGVLLLLAASFRFVFT